MKKRIPLMHIGIIGLLIVIALNLIGFFALHQPAAEVFSSSWWPTWFSSYIVWGSLIVIGSAIKYGRNSVGAEA